jgi:transposase
LFPQKEQSHEVRRRRPPQEDYQHLRGDASRPEAKGFGQATASYEWLVGLVEKRADRVVLATFPTAGLAPGFRESAGRRKDGSITKEGPRLLRWAMIQLAWRLVHRTAYWRAAFERLERKAGKKKAIVAVARPQQSPTPFPQAREL